MLPAVSGISARRVLLTGSGEGELNEINAGKIVSAVAKAVSAIAGTIAVDLTAVATSERPEVWWAEQLVLAIHANQYKYSLTKADSEPSPKAGKLIWIGSDISTALTVADAKGAGTDYARELGNLPPNICTPTYLAEQAQALSAEPTT